MKILFIIVIFFCITTFSIAQSSLNKAISFAKEYLNTDERLYCNKEIFNANHNMWPVVGTYSTTDSYYHTRLFDPYPGVASIFIIEKEIYQAAVHYYEYFIYNNEQKLSYYIYSLNSTSPENGDSTELIIKFTENGTEIFSEYNTAALSDNYFFYNENVFNEDKIRERSDAGLAKALDNLGLCHFETEIKHIKDVYKNTNNLSTIKTIKKEHYTAIYHKNELVKINVSGKRTIEFYLENNQLVFAFYNKTEDEEAMRVYVCESGPFRIILGDKILYPHEYSDFSELAYYVLQDFENAFQKFNAE